MHKFSIRLKITAFFRIVTFSGQYVQKEGLMLSEIL